MSRVVLRGVPDHLHREIRQAAAWNRRTVSAEILFRLEESFAQRTVDTEQLLERIQRRWKSIGALDLSEEVLRRMKNEGRP